MKALCGAGSLLLLGEVFFPRVGYAVFGALAWVGAVVVAVLGCGIDLAALLLLAGTTLVSLGFLVVLAWFPNAPMAVQFQRRAKEAPPATEPEA